MQQGKSPEEWARQIEQDIADHHVFVYAKGEKNAAMCGFSHRVMQIFNQLGTPFEVRNIFSDPNLRPSLCAFTNWPTTPQVFIGGKFVGGCDIVTEMFENGDLKRLVEESQASRP